jgi:hypothetical protein
MVIIFTGRTTSLAGGSSFFPQADRKSARPANNRIMAGKAPKDRFEKLSFGTFLTGFIFDTSDCFCGKGSQWFSPKPNLLRAGCSAFNACGPAEARIQGHIKIPDFGCYDCMIKYKIFSKIIK